MHLRLTLLCLISLSMSGCALFNQPTPHTSIPKVKVPEVPGGIATNWRYLGTSDDGQLIIEINDSSIKLTTNQIYTFEDRKTVIYPPQFSSYAPNQPHYKYIISIWQMDCSNKQYIINQAILYNESGIMLKKYDYTNDATVKWVQFGKGSIAELQYNYICLNQNRTLGY